MAKKALPLRIDEDLFERLEVRRKDLGQTRTMFVERALESALRVPSLDGLGPSPPASVLKAAAAAEKPSMEQGYVEGQFGAAEAKAAPKEMSRQARLNAMKYGRPK